MSKDILILSDDIRGHTGFAVNGRLVNWALSEKWDVATVSVGARHPGTTTVGGRQLEILPGYDDPTDRTGSKGVKGLTQAIEEHEPDIVISVIDVQMCSYIGQINRPQTARITLRGAGKKPDIDSLLRTVKGKVSGQDFEKSFDWVAQIPVDGVPLPDDWEGFLKEVDYPIAMSKFGKESMETQFPFADIDVIPHGVDYRDVRDIDLNSFHVGSVNRNQFRKQYPRLLEAWGKFYERAGRPGDITFYAHADYDDEAGWPLVRYIKRNNLEDPLYTFEGIVNRSRLMEIYNRMDVFTSATGGEGFGLTTIEAMAQETPVVITDYTTSKELILDGDPTPRGKLVSPAIMYDEHPRFAGVQRALVDTDEFADKLLDYYENQDKAKRHGKNARNWVEENLSWESIANQWVNYIDRIINT